MLVEHTVEAALSALERRVESELDPKIQELESRMLAKEKELRSVEEQLGASRPGVQESEATEKPANVGILA